MLTFMQRKQKAETAFNEMLAPPPGFEALPQGRKAAKRASNSSKQEASLASGQSKLEAAQQAAAAALKGLTLLFAEFSSSPGSPDIQGLPRLQALLSCLVVSKELNCNLYPWLHSAWLKVREALRTNAEYIAKPQ